MTVVDYAIQKGWITVTKDDGWRKMKQEYQRAWYRKHHPPKPRKHQIELDKDAFASRQDYYREYRKLLMRKVRAERKDAAL